MIDSLLKKYVWEHILAQRLKRMEPLTFQTWFSLYQQYLTKTLSSMNNTPITVDSYLIFEDELNFKESRLLQTTMPLFLPKDLHVRLIITSTDVIHSFSLPAFGVKIDAVPGRLNAVSIYPKISGTFFGQCSELCGINHAFMPIEVIVLDQAIFYNALMLKMNYSWEGQLFDYV